MHKINTTIMVTHKQILCGSVTRLEQLIKIHCSHYAKTCLTIVCGYLYYSSLFGSRYIRCV
jgi:hypothetical protein